MQFSRSIRKTLKKDLSAKKTHVERADLYLSLISREPESSVYYL